MNPDSQEILKLLYTFIFSVLAWNATFLWVRAKTTHTFNRYLSLFIWSMLTPILFAYSMLAFPAIAGKLAIAAKSFIWLYGPFLLLFVHVVLKKRNYPVRSYWHFLPFALVLMVSSLGEVVPANVHSALPIAGLAHAAGYAIASLRLIVANRGQVNILLSAYRYSAYYWVLFLIAALLLLIMCDFYIHINLWLGRSLNMGLWNGFIILIGFYLAAISTFSILSSQQLYNPLSPASTHLKGGACEEPAPVERRRLRELDESMANGLSNALHTLMREERVYLDNDLSMSELAKMLGISNHQLSELLNVHLNVSFYGYINELRVKEALELLNRPDNNAAIADIAYQVGFNSKNSFYKSFREHHGCTPNAYRKAARTSALTAAAD